MKSEIKQMTQAEVSRLALKTKPMALLFMTEWCGEFQIAESILSQLKEEFSGRVSLVKIQYGVHQLPTLLVSDNRQDSSVLVGINPRDRVKNAIKKILGEK